MSMRKEQVWFKDFNVLLNECTCECCMALAHWHDCWEMLYLESGFATQVCDTGLTRYQAGDIVLIAPKTVHSTFSGSTGSRIIVVQFDEALWPGAGQGGYTAADNPYLEALDGLFRQLHTEYTLRQDGFLNMTHGALLQIFAYLTRLGSVPVLRHEGYFKARHIFSYIDARLGTGLTLTEAAHALGYSPQHLTTVIKACSGYSFKPYMDYARIMAAVRMLRFEQLPVHTAAEKLGYSDPTAFSWAFRRITGLSPRACRNQGAKS